ncbi:MAG: DUF4129 domain-containing protein [Myxococcota bacterium]
MQTERIAVEVRPRAGYEAVDLGFRFARAVIWPLFPAHALVVGLVALALYAGLSERLWLAGLLVWWLKPLYDRVALAVLADALFGRTPTLLETLASLPRLITRTGLLHSLTWLRFSPLRSFTMPVLQLEGLRGIERSRRVSVLVGRDSRAGLGLLFACGIFELVILAAGLQLAATFRPEGALAEFWRDVVQGGGPELSFLEALLYPLAIAAVEPFYVAGGFALYVNRRIWLEGWDIDLAFRKLEQRVAAESPRAPRARAISLGLLALALALPAHTRADDETRAEPATCETPGPAGAGACIDAVLASEEFATVEKVELWLPKASEPDKSADPSLLARFGLWLASVGGTLLRVVAWLGLAAVLTGLGVAVVRSLRERDLRPGAQSVNLSGARVSLDLRPEALPADVVAEARARFARGDAPGALSLLYRGALVQLVRGFGLAVPAGATEGECERLAREALDAGLARDFKALTRAWVFCAYAHQPPAPDAFAELCQRWQPHLRSAA